MDPSVIAGAGVCGSISAFRSGFVFTVAVSSSKIGGLPWSVSSRARRSRRQFPLGAGPGYVGLSGFSSRNRICTLKMSVAEYQDRGPLQVTSSLNLDNLVGKSVIVTGGASGLGKAYAQVFAKAGAYVTIGDFNEKAGKETVAEIEGNVQFVKCDVRNWDDQVRMFEAAVGSSPHKSCDVVIANAGIVGADDLYQLQDPSLPPVKPDLRIIEINLLGVAYTTKLALHYFRRQRLVPERDRCLILKASVAAYVDQPGSPQYNISKWGIRGLMRNLRRTAWKESIRVNLVAPWFVRTPILDQGIQDFLDGKGVGFATVDDACTAMLKIASDTTVNGRAIGIVHRKEAPEGYMDLDRDDYKEGDALKEWQEVVLDTALRIVS